MFLTLFHADFGKEFLPNFVERCILKLLLSKLCTVPLSVQNRALSEGGGWAKRCPEKGRKRGGQHRGQKAKRTRENRSGTFDQLEKGCPKSLLHKCNPVSHQCNRFFCPHTPRHLLHPLLTLGKFDVSGPCSRHSGLQTMLS